MRLFHPTDFSGEDRAAFVHSVRLAQAAGGELILFNVIDEEERPDHFPRVRELLQAWSAGAGTGFRVKKVVNSGRSPSSAIIRYLEGHPVDLIVLYSHQRNGVARFLDAAVAEPVARETRTATLFIPSERPGFVDARDGGVRLRRVLVAVDEALPAQRALDLTAALVDMLGCAEGTITLLHVGHRLPPVREPTLAGWQVQSILRQGPIVDTLLRSAADLSADLIVMTTAGRHGFLDALRGSTTERVLRQSSCPLLAVPAPVGE